MPSDLSGPERLLAWLGSRAIQIAAEETEAHLLEECPWLLQDGEHVELAFKVERDKYFFTTKRLLFRDKKAITGLKVEYRSIPYSCMAAFSVQTAGKVLDADSECRIWTHMFRGPIALNFVKGKADVFSIQQLLNSKLLALRPTTDGPEQPRPPLPLQDPQQPTGAFEELLSLVGGDATQIDAALVERQLLQAPPVLYSGERVMLAFKCGRDSTLFTTQRILIIDVKGWSGKKIEYRSILWSCVRAFSVETVGAVLDRDATVRVWTSMHSYRVIGQDLRKSKADVMAIQTFLASQILGADAAPRSCEAAPRAVSPGPTDTVGDLLAWLGDDAGQIDANLLESWFRRSFPILQANEHVEMAFKGRRDLTLLTTKRLLLVDVKGWTGEKREFKTVPYTSIQAFAVRSAGAVLDKDSEMMIWTDIMHEPKKGDDPPEPGMSFLEQDFRKDKVDLMAIHRYLSARVLGSGGAASTDGSAAPPDAFASTPEGGVESFLSWLGDDARQINALEVDRQLHTVNPMLQSDERVELAFKAGRDMTLFTTKRALLIDVQGWTGAKVQYLSVPYASLRAFSVESAGAFDRDAEVRLYLRAPWLKAIRQDLRKGKADILAIHSFLTAKLLGPAAREPQGLELPSTAGAPVPAALASGPGSGLDAFLAWIGNDASQINRDEVDRQLHTAPPILQPEERVELAFKVGRDMCLLTSRRLLLVDVQGLTGRKVEYKSVPYKHCEAFSVQTAGKFDRDAEARVWTDVPGLACISQDLWKGKADVFSVQSLLAAKILREWPPPACSK